MIWKYQWKKSRSLRQERYRQVLSCYLFTYLTPPVKGAMGSGGLTRLALQVFFIWTGKKRTSIGPEKMVAPMGSPIWNALCTLFLSFPSFQVVQRSQAGEWLSG